MRPRLFCFSYFRRYPQYHQVFPAFKHVPVDELADNKKFQAHCQNIMSTLSNSIDALDDADLTDAILHSTGERHGRRGQGTQEFIVSSFRPFFFFFFFWPLYASTIKLFIRSNNT